MTINPNDIRRILIRGTNWVGDAVMSIPAIREARRIFPQAHLDLLVRPWVKDVYSTADFVDEIVVYDREGMHRGLAGRRRLASDLRSRRYDLAILLQNAFEAAALVWWARIPLRLGYARDRRGFLLTHPISVDPEIDGVHQAYYYLGILSGARLVQSSLWKDRDYRLNISLTASDSDRAAARDMIRAHGIEPGRPVIGLNAGASYGGAKRWPPDRFAEAASRLAESRDARVVLFGSQSEVPIAREVAGRLGARAANLAGRTTLGLLMGLLEECSLLITNDSGPMHLAAALGIPQVAIFGSSSDRATGPLSEVAEVVRNPVECSPCFLRECPTDFRCMTGITAQRVIEAAERVLAKGKRS